MTFMRSR